MAAKIPLKLKVELKDAVVAYREIETKKGRLRRRGAAESDF
jgi:hypothetical protein